MATADQVITSYVLDPSGYVSGARRVQQATRTTGEGMGKFGGFIKDIEKPLQSVGRIAGFFARGLEQMGGALVGAAAGFAAFAAYSIDKYAEYNQLRLTFAGIFQDMGKADQMMAALEKYSMKSMFPEEALRRGALTLAQAKLSVQDFLPVLEILAAKSGDVSLEGLINAADVLRRIRGGQIAEGLGPEGLGRFGINRQDLMRLGARFDGSGQFLGTWQEALGLIKAAAAESKPILDMMEGSEAAKLSNAMEAVEKAVRSAGQVLSAQFLPSIEQGGNFLVYISKSGIIEGIAKGFGSLFDVTGKGDFIGFLSTVVATLETIPQLIKDIGVWSVNTARQIYAMTPVGFVDNNFFGGKMFKPMVDSLSSAVGIPGIMNRAQSLREQFMSGAASSPTGPAAFPTTSGNEGDSMIAQIERNTRATAANTKKFTESTSIVGGGDLARQGVPIVERGRRHGRKGSEIDQIANLLEQLVNRVRSEAIGVIDYPGYATR